MGWKALKEHYRISHMVQVTHKGICIGSGYVHDLIVVSMDGEVTPSSIVRRNEGGELGRYMSEMEADRDKLVALIQQPDMFERSVVVFTYDRSSIIQCECEAPGWPNVTHDGRMMYENTFSTDRAEVVGWALRNAEARVENWTENAAQRQRDADDAKAELDAARINLATLCERETVHPHPTALAKREG